MEQFLAMDSKMAGIKQCIINCFRKKELERFLKLRGINLKGLKKMLQDKALEIATENDYETIRDIFQNQIREQEMRIKNPNENQSSMFSLLNPKVNVNASNLVTITQIKSIQNKPQARPEVNKVLNAEPVTVNLQDVILIDEDPIEDDKTGLFYIKKKIFVKTTLSQICSRYNFKLTEAEYLQILEGRKCVDELLKFDIQLQLRFFKNDLDFDSVSPGAKVWFNGTQIPFMAGELKPINLTKLLNFLKPENDLTFYMPYSADTNRFTLNIIKRKGDDEILNGLLKNVCTKEGTINSIKKKFSKDDDLQIDMLKVSINCPLGKSRMKYPCRALGCTHLQCFDGLTYVKMNERKPKWKCPVCYQLAPLKCLIVDKYFEEIVNSDKLKDDTTEVQLLSDGSWCLDSLTDVFEILDTPVFKASTKSDVIVLDDTPKKKPSQNGLSRFKFLTLQNNNFN